MGILNVTPDSFADGGKHDTYEKAIARGLEMIKEGVDIIDVGGESTRPGAERISVEVELERVIPVIKTLSQLDVAISIDTMRSEVARAAVKAGASIVNDVSGGIADPQMHKTVAEIGCRYILMHWRGHSKEMDSLATYKDVVAEVIAEIRAQLNKAIKAGISQEKIILDPGLGFSKNADHNWEILQRIDQLIEIGYPVLIGASRKRFLGGENPDAREMATQDLTRELLKKDIWAVRVHSVSPHKEIIGAR